MRLYILILVLCLVEYGSLRSFGDHGADNDNCGYKSCPLTKEGHVNVHLIPHSHDDVGWVKTVDEFFYGGKSFVYRAAVINIYDNVLKAVQKNKDRRFIYVETAFFWKWWLLQAEQERNALKDLVNKGQIEFTGGGWSMNDEAVTNYQSIVDQMTWGLRKLKDTFGDCGRPKMGWQIDPFGHSSEMASIFAHLGYDGVILARIDFQDKESRLLNRTMELVWRGSNSIGRRSDIFTSVLHNNYDAPDGFCFDMLCADEALVDDLDSPLYNIDVKAEAFISRHLQDWVGSYQTSNVMVPMGRDFAYQEAEGWFTNMDRLIKYVNEKQEFNGTKYHLFYSTPSCYAKAVQKETQGVLASPLKTDDFFPYATDDHSFWTGFYTSRPTLKRFERLGNNFLQIAKQLYTLTDLPPELEPKLDSLREAMGVMQHHDAITGTEKEEVAYDYARLLHIGMTKCEEIAQRALASLIHVEENSLKTCPLVNISQCPLTEHSDTFVVTVYNPLGRPVDKYVRLPVFGTSYDILDPEGNPVRCQIVPVLKAVQEIIGRKSNATLELVFAAKEVPPLGFKSFYVKERPGNDDVTPEDLSLMFSYSNREGTGFEIDPSTGLVSQIRANGIEMDVDQRFWYYNGSTAWMEDFASRPSGAYIFRPDGQYPIRKISDTAWFEVYQGDLVTEIHQRFSDNVSQVVRVYSDEKYLEFDWVVGPIAIDGSWPSLNGKEIISRFSTPLKSQSTFYTDSNGRELMKRIRNFRPTWNVALNETETSNYYPVTSRILIRDDLNNLEFAVLTDRAEGGSSLSDGEIELMLLRNSVLDDRLGVGEALDEVAYSRPIMARGSHYVTLGNIRNSPTEAETIASLEHQIASQRLLDSWIFLSVPPEESFAAYKAKHSMEFSGLTRSLPKNVHLMTLEPWAERSYLLRLEHLFEKEEDPVLSQPATVDLQNLFSTFEIETLRETTLGGNQWLEDNQRLGFKSEFQSDKVEFTKEEPSGGYRVELEPMQIRTFVIEIRPKKL